MVFMCGKMGATRLSGAAPKVVLEATNQAALAHVELEHLKAHAAS